MEFDDGSFSATSCEQSYPGGPKWSLGGSKIEPKIDPRESPNRAKIAYFDPRVLKSVPRAEFSVIFCGLAIFWAQFDSHRAVERPKSAERVSRMVVGG